MNCPCGGKNYETCCGRWHAGVAAPTPEALMRSRYTAYARGDQQYLLSTWHASKRPDTVGFDPAVKWLGLKIVAAPTALAFEGEVEFVARYRVGGGSAVRLHERSRFLRENDRWYYLDGLQKEVS